MQKSILMLFAFLVGSVLYAQEEITLSPSDLSDHLEVIFSKRGLDIPPVHLADITSQVSNETDTITSTLVYNMNEALSEGYYYWNNGSWHSLFPEPKAYDYLFLWDVDNVELTYLDDSGDVRVVGIGGIENAEFMELQSDSKTLKYKNEAGSRILVDLGQIAGEEKSVMTLIYRQDNTLLFMNEEEKVVQVDLTKGPHEVSNTVRELEGALASEIVKIDSTTALETDLEEDLLTTDVDVPSESDGGDEVEVVEDKNESVEVEDEDFTTDKEGVDKKEDGIEELEKSESMVEEKEEVVSLGREIKSINDNEDGTFTIVYAGGSRFTSRDLNHPEGGLKEEDRELVDVVNNGDGSFTALFSDGTSLLSSEIKDFQNFGGPSDEGYPGVELVIDNGDGTYNIILTDGTELASVDLAALSKPEERKAEEDGKGVLSIVMNEDETYTVTFTDGTEMNSKDLSDINMPAEKQGDLEEEKIDTEQDVLDNMDPEEVAMEGLDRVLAGKTGMEVLGANNNEGEKDKVNSGNDASDTAGESTEGSLSAEEQTTTPMSRGVKSIEEKTDGTLIISLTDGTVFVTPNFYSEGEDRSQPRNIESIIDNNDGTFIIGLTGGIKLASIETLSLPEPFVPETPVEEEVVIPDEPKSVDEIDELVEAEESIEGVEKSKAVAEDEIEVLEEGEAAPETQTDGDEDGEEKDESVSDDGDKLDETLLLDEVEPLKDVQVDEAVEEAAQDQEFNIRDIDKDTERELEEDIDRSEETGVEDGVRESLSQEEVIRRQKEEIEALKRKDRENEEELQEMNERLERLEVLFDGEKKPEE